MKGTRWLHGACGWKNAVWPFLQDGIGASLLHVEPPLARFRRRLGWFEVGQQAAALSLTTQIALGAECRGAAGPRLLHSAGEGPH
jgi:hypothetical protein